MRYNIPKTNTFNYVGKKIFFLGKEGKMKEIKAKDQGRQKANVGNIHSILGSNTQMHL